MARAWHGRRVRWWRLRSGPMCCDSTTRIPGHGSARVGARHSLHSKRLSGMHALLVEVVSAAAEVCAAVGVGPRPSSTMPPWSHPEQTDGAGTRPGPRRPASTNPGSAGRAQDTVTSDVLSAVSWVVTDEERLNTAAWAEGYIG